jgi:hypothetical protein
MKETGAKIFWLFLIVAAQTSCSTKKDNVQVNPFVPRQIKLTLFTTTDFSGDTNTVVFEAFIQNTGNKILWDSVFLPMRIKDIPDANNKIIIQKQVSGDDGSVLKAGFNYSLTGVGYSWYFDTVGRNTNNKIVEFNFR